MIMLQSASTALLWFSAIGCAVIAGVYFAFSTFIMAALGSIDKASGISAMQAINDVILKSLFMPLFLGTTIVSVVLAVIAVLRWNAPGSLLIVFAAVIYVAGMFMVTMIFNVPLNNALAASDPASGNAAAIWTTYLKDWTFWNHVRTVASVTAGAFYIAALVKG
jgi:uncharacterized membrane protein